MQRTCHVVYVGDCEMKDVSTRLARGVLPVTWRPSVPTSLQDPTPQGARGWKNLITFHSFLLALTILLSASELLDALIYCTIFKRHEPRTNRLPIAQ